MKLIIAGSREIHPLPQEIAYWIEYKFKLKNIDYVISGTAAGADFAGENYALKFGKKLTKFPANWSKYGKSAGIMRNKQMAKVADAAIVFINNNSPGSLNMIETMKKLKKPVYVVEFTNKLYTQEYLIDDSTKEDNDVTRFSEV